MTFAKLLNLAIQKAGKQEQLAVRLDLAPSALSKRLNGEVGWQETEIDKLLDFAGCDISDQSVNAKITNLKQTIKIILEE